MIKEISIMKNINHHSSATDRVALIEHFVFDAKTSRKKTRIVNEAIEALADIKETIDSRFAITLLYKYHSAAFENLFSLCL
jgi:hypothetical protein